jgi:hypothetical protein
MFEISVELNGAAAATDWVQKVSGRLVNFAPVFRGHFKEAVADFFERQFESEGSAGGTPWAPLSPVTLMIRRAQGITSEKSLWASGTMRAAWGGMRDDVEVAPLLFKKSSSVGLPGLHQHGFSTRLFGRGAPRWVPARPIIPDVLPTQVVGRWENVLMRWITGGRA